jgi:hypothetical protein
VVPTEHNNYVPVGVLSFAYPAYPVNSVAWGSVVVQLTVDHAGEVKGVDFLYGMEVFKSFVSDALKQWRFQPATLNGKPIIFHAAQSLQDGFVQGFGVNDDAMLGVVAVFQTDDALADRHDELVGIGMVGAAGVQSTFYRPTSP